MIAQLKRWGAWFAIAVAALLPGIAYFVGRLRGRSALALEQHQAAREVLAELERSDAAAEKKGEEKKAAILDAHATQVKTAGTDLEKILKVTKARGELVGKVKN